MVDFKDLSQTQPAGQDPTVQNLADATQKINRDFKEKEVAARAQASAGQYTYVDIARTPINPDLFYLVDAAQASEASLIPFFRLGMKLRVAVANPTTPQAVKILDELKKQAFEVSISLATEEGIKAALVQFHNAQELAKPKFDNNVEENLEEYQKEIENLAKLSEKIGVSNAKEGLHILQMGAIKTNTSDIHFQPQESGTLVRFRIDGILQKVCELKKEVYDQLAQQIKYESGMKLNVGYIPQDGRLQFMVNERRVDVRVSTIPTEYGETIVMRLLDSGKKFASFEELGFSAKHLQILKEVSDLSQGMILVTGPTGSGKTTSLYSMLNIYNTPERKIITLEDPIEYHLDRIVQSQINEKKGYTFAKGLESILRQDPDVVMIGEIRDLDTANTALQAALTGHVMLSTLHTNSALESIPRLINMGLEPFMIAPALDTLMAQRLVRTFCPHCVKEEPINAETKAYLESEVAVISQSNGSQYEIPASLPVAVGCELCNHTGYLGRIVIAEIFRVNGEFKDMIIKRATTTELEKKALEMGLLNMRRDGILKVIAKKTSLEEVKRVTN